MSSKNIPKVVASINQKDQLLVLRHAGFPTAGLRVPAGTLESGEKPEQAVLREAPEEKPELSGGQGFCFEKLAYQLHRREA